jgi:enamine deaminase RidA (YjgF/YER057c/UK114 family)
VPPSCAPSSAKPSLSSGSGKIVYTAGQLARDIDGNCVGKGDMRAQMEQTFQNLNRGLKAAGATWLTSSRPTRLSPTSTSSRSALTHPHAL